MIKEFRGEYRWLSNFYDAEVYYEGEPYKSVEHAYVAAKTTNKELRKEVQQIAKASDVKKFGKEIELRHDWNRIRLKVMESLLRQKFAIPEFRQRLRWTGVAEIVEGNSWHDNFYGSCVCDECGDKGQNNLGKLLMMIRDDLQMSLDFSAN